VASAALINLCRAPRSAIDADLDPLDGARHIARAFERHFHLVPGKPTRRQFGAQKPARPVDETSDLESSLRHVDSA
jgi:hypothetical protein